MAYLSVRKPSFGERTGQTALPFAVPAARYDRLADSSRATSYGVGFRHNFADALPNVVVPGDAPVQRVLKSPVATYRAPEDLPQDKQPSGTVVRLVKSKDMHYAPTGADYSKDQFQALADKKYLLGEHHGDGTWAERTQPWPHVATMREIVKAFNGQSAVEGEAITASGVVPQNEGLPLEDMHSYALTICLIARQALKGFDPTKKVSDEQKAAIEEDFRALGSLLVHYDKVAKSWYSALKNKDDAQVGRAADLLTIGLGDADYDDGRNAALQIASGTMAVTALKPTALAQIHLMLADIVGRLIKLIDTRPYGGLFNLFKQGADPVANRSTITTLAGGGGAGDWKAGRDAALKEGNVPRENAMASKIAAAQAPLLVQLGDAHVQRLKDRLGSAAVSVPKGADFVEIATHLPDLSDLLGPIK